MGDVDFASLLWLIRQINPSSARFELRGSNCEGSKSVRFKICEIQNLRDSNCEIHVCNISSRYAGMVDYVGNERTRRQPTSQAGVVVAVVQAFSVEGNSNWRWE